MHQHRFIRVCGRSLWAALFGAHAFWFVGALRSPESSLSSPVLLGLALVFFLAKLLDLRHLRIQWSGRALCCAILVVVLLHAQVFDQASLSDSSMLGLALPAQVLMSLALRILVLLCTVHFLFTMTDARGRKIIRCARLYHAIATVVANLRRRVCALASAPFRGPPRPGELVA